VQPVSVPAPWNACLLPAVFPVQQPLRAALSGFIEQLTLLLEDESPLQRHVFLHCWKLSEHEVGRLLQENLQLWQPRLGMGLFPNRQPPTTLTQEAFMDANADRIQQKAVELPAYRMAYLDADAGERRRAAVLQFGAGALTQMFSDGSFAEMQEAGRRTYLPTITAPVYTHERFYLPLLDRSALSTSPSPERFESWMGRIHFYVRESAEDGGVLIVSRLPLQPLLDRAARLADVELAFLQGVP
jgi:hypothetical protein